MAGAAAGEVLDLLSAGDSHDRYPGVGSGLEGRSQNPLEGCFRILEMLLLESERSGHAAARSRYQLGVEPGTLEEGQRQAGIGLGLLLTVAVEEDPGLAIA